MSGISPATLLLASALAGGGGGGGGGSTPTKVSELINDEQYLSSKIAVGGKYRDNIYVDGSGTIPSDAHTYLIKDIQFKRGASSSLATTTPKQGEPVFEFDSATKKYRLKIGDGTTTYANLPYIGADFVPSTDGKSVIMQSSQLQIYGFSTTTTGKLPRKSASGALEWITLDSALKLTSGDAVKITKTTAANGDVTEKFDVLYDNSTVKLANNKLTVPIDNSTIQVKNGKVTAVQPKAGNGINVTTSAGQPVISANLKAGANIVLSTDITTGQITIGATGGGSTGGDKVAQGQGISISTNATTGVKTISGAYVAGPYIHIDPVSGSANKMQISVDTSVINDTVRPVKVEGTEILNREPSSGALDFSGRPSEPDGIKMLPTGGKVNMSIANKNIIQVNENDMLTNLENYFLTLDCGNAGNNW